MDLPYVEKPTKDNNGVNYKLVDQNLIDRTVDANGLKQKDSEKLARIFLARITTNDSTQKQMGGKMHRICRRNQKTLKN